VIPQKIAENSTHRVMCTEIRVFIDFAVESRKFAQTKSQEEGLVVENAD
jgi:hypothetical protein